MCPIILTEVGAWTFGERLCGGAWFRRCGGQMRSPGDLLVRWYTGTLVHPGTVVHWYTLARARVDNRGWKNNPPR